MGMQQVFHGDLPASGIKSAFGSEPPRFDMSDFPALGDVPESKGSSSHIEFQSEAFPALSPSTPGSSQLRGFSGRSSMRPSGGDRRSAAGMVSSGVASSRSSSQLSSGASQLSSIPHLPSGSAIPSASPATPVGVSGQSIPHGHFSSSSLNGSQHGSLSAGGLSSSLPGSMNSGLSGPARVSSPAPAPVSGASNGLSGQPFQSLPQQPAQPRRVPRSAAASPQEFRRDASEFVFHEKKGPDRFGLIGLLSVIRMTDPDLNTLALGTDLTTLGLNLNSTDVLYATFAYPCSEVPTRREPDYVLPYCYYMQPPALKTSHLAKFQLETLFYIFYNMPKDTLQVYAAKELYNRGWMYHKELKLWFTRPPIDKSKADGEKEASQGYVYFDVNSWERRLFLDSSLPGGAKFMSEEELHAATTFH